MRRVVEPELLDVLPPTDENACGSRADLQRINNLMGNARQLARAFFEAQQSGSRTGTARIIELGAGDGTLSLKLVGILTRRGIHGRITLVDRQNAVSKSTREAFTDLNWQVDLVISDVFEWLEQDQNPSDFIYCNLFLHHFDQASLQVLLAKIGERNTFFAACEPRRSSLSMVACHTLCLIGCNGVTRHDAKVSVRAGFGQNDLSTLWPTGDNWRLIERKAGIFSHFFAAQRTA